MPLLSILFVAVAGALTTVESGANAQMTKAMHGPWWPAIVLSVTTVVCSTVVLLLSGSSVPTRAMLASAPWWAWGGGLIAALYGYSMLIFPARLGSAVFTGFTVSAAVLASVALDHFGLVGFKQHTAGVWRLVGAGLMVGGLALISLF